MKSWLVSFPKKLARGILAILRAIDILVCAIWLTALYPFGLSCRPTGYETISAYVGRADLNGHRWARLAAIAIDWGAEVLGDGPNHCYRSWMHWKPLHEKRVLEQYVER
jgi:hypothetical protein